MSLLKEKFAAKLPAIRAELSQLVKEHGNKVVSEVTLQQMFGGMRARISTPLKSPDLFLSR